MIEKILGWFIPFILGLASIFIVDSIRRCVKRKRDRNFVISYLKNSLLSSIPVLIKEYNYVIKNIEALGLGKYTIEAFETFNTNVLKGIAYTDYYQIFTGRNKPKFILLVEIISIIDFLSQHLPSKLNNNYFAIINNHLIETNNRGDKNHVLDCEFCKCEKESAIEHIKAQISAVKILENKIKELIKTK